MMDTIPQETNGFSTGVPKKQPLPTFIKGWSITALVLSSFRLLYAPLSIIGYFMIEDGDPLKNTVIFEVLSHVALLILGLWANIAILTQRKIGYAVGKVHVVVIILTFFLAIAQVAGTLQGEAGDETTIIAMIGGAMFTMLIRIVLLCFYGVAIKRYGQFIATNDNDFTT